MNDLIDIKTEQGTPLKLDIEGCIYHYNETTATWENTRLQIEIDKEEFLRELAKKKKLSM